MTNQENNAQEQEAANYLKIVLELNEILLKRNHFLEKKHQVFEKQNKQLKLTGAEADVVKSPIFNFNIN